MNRITIRVYGVCIQDGRVLVCDEQINGYLMTKFPGGGLKVGEGTIDCLKRELMEEFQAEIDVYDHIYTTDFFQPSAFDLNTQVLSIYYSFKLKIFDNRLISSEIYGFGDATNDAISFRWVEMGKLNSSEFTFPIDRVVVEKILSVR
ncbi:MAG: NUDIX domain-containing protein [Flavobacteriales bacterium]